MNSLRALPIKCRWLSQFATVLIGAGLITGPALSTSAARTKRPPAVQADVLPSVPETPVPGSDLLLRREGERTGDALAAFSEGLAAEEDADTDRAMQAYRRALSLDSSNTELAVKVAFQLARTGEVAQSIDILKDAAKAAPKDLLPPLCLSQIYDKFLKKQELAQKYALIALELDPGNIGPYLALFDLYSVAGQQKKADAILERAAKSESPDSLFWLSLAEVYSRQALKGDNEITPDELRKINPLLGKALASGEKNPEVLGKVADFYVLTKQIKAAIPLYLQGLASGKPVSAEELLSMHDKLARCYLADGQREPAIAVLEQMVKDAPTRYETYELLGELYTSSNQWAKAIASYQQALLIDGTQADNFLRIADLQLRLKQVGEAIKTLTEARTKFPGVSQLSYSLAIALSQAKRHTLALSTFEETLHEAKNSNESLLNSAFYLSYGAAAEQAGDLTRAVPLLRKSIELDPHSGQACNYLGYMWVDRGINLEEAGELIKRAVALEPNNAAFLDSLGWYYFKKGDYDKALPPMLKASEEIKPGDAVIFEHLGDIYLAQGNRALALTSWKKALALDPENKGLAGKIAGAQKP
ncbi:MAG: tetratricopeptide repeat protein [Verrucomicrobiota bacterium]